MDSLEQSIRRRLIGYLAGKEAYDDFVDWMYGVIWNIEQSGDRDAARLGYSIMLAIAEFDNDVFSLERFQEYLRSLVESTDISLENHVPATSMPRSA